MNFFRVDRLVVVGSVITVVGDIHLRDDPSADQPVGRVPGLIGPTHQRQTIAQAGGQAHRNCPYQGHVAEAVVRLVVHNERRRVH